MRGSRLRHCPFQHTAHLLPAEVLSTNCWAHCSFPLSSNQPSLLPGSMAPLSTFPLAGLVSSPTLLILHLSDPTSRNLLIEEKKKQSWKEKRLTSHCPWLTAEAMVGTMELGRSSNFLPFTCSKHADGLGSQVRSSLRQEGGR